MKSIKFKKIGFFLLLAGLTTMVRAETALQIVPSTFDFGWVPDNAVVRCQVYVRNTGEDMVALTAVQPSCGCTATDFTPEGLAGAEQAKINLTFNTRGYANVKFDKVVKVKAGVPEDEHTVHLIGHVANPNAVVMPEGDGVVSFASHGAGKATISIKNNSNKLLALKVIQDPEGWVLLKLPKTGLPANGSALIGIEISDSSDDESRHTSATFEAGDGAEAQRFTIAIRTGEAPEAYRKLRVAPKSSPAKPVASPKKHT